MGSVRCGLRRNPTQSDAIRRSMLGYILTTDQSDAGCSGMFSRRDFDAGGSAYIAVISVDIA
eukprot:4958781-Pyramimonas_sp.AAC.1